MTKDWMVFYYAEPQPDRFVEEVRKLAAQGALAEPARAFPMVVFLGCVIAANPSRLRSWFDALSDLSPSDWHSLEDAARFSQTPEASAYLAARGVPASSGPAPAGLLKLRIEDPTVLDCLWALYFATGDYRAVRRIISALDYMSDLGAAKAYAHTNKTDEDRARALRDGIFQAAAWSLESLLRQHEPLKAFCGELVRSGDMTPNERCALAISLAKVDPTLWRVQIDAETKQASIAWLGPVT